MDQKQKDKDQPTNPHNCWDFFMLYSINTVFTFFNIIYLVQHIIRHADFNPAEEFSLSQIQIVQSSLLIVSVIGYVIFQIPSIITALQYVFEEVPSATMFKKSVNWIIRSQWFLPLFYFSLILTKNFFTVEPVQLALVLMSMIVDIYLSNAVYDKGNETKRKVLQIFSIFLALMLLPYCDYITIVFLIIYKAYTYFLNKKTGEYLSNVKDGKTQKRMKILGVFTVINMVSMHLLRSIYFQIDSR